mgnify:CR=1 FL=1
MIRTLLLTLLTLCSLFARGNRASNIILVKAGNVDSLISAIEQAGVRNAAPDSPRLYILIPDGLYDLGETCLTTISGYNIALIGQSMEGTVIMNAPKVEKEGIGRTATLLNRGMNTYVQDLTLKNALDYYHSGAAGRAVCWQDKGQRTIFKHVRMLSYQDTYYSHSEDCQHYFDDCEIHGTVDFICGAGDVWFNRCTIVAERRNADGSGDDVIAAPRTSVTNWGYVFDHCTIRSDMSSFHLARGWHTLPRCAWLYTRLENPEKLSKGRFDPNSIRSVDCQFYEYCTTDAEGRLLTPPTNVVTFSAKGQTRSAETVLDSYAARRFQLKAVFPDWRPEKVARKLSKTAVKLKAAHM